MLSMEIAFELYIGHSALIRACSLAHMLHTVLQRFLAQVRPARSRFRIDGTMIQAANQRLIHRAAGKLPASDGDIYARYGIKPPTRDEIEQAGRKAMAKLAGDRR